MQLSVAALRLRRSLQLRTCDASICIVAVVQDSDNNATVKHSDCT